MNKSIFTKLSVLFILIVFTQMNVYGQLTGIKTIDPGGSGANNYTTFTLAINALNSSGVGVGGVTFNVKDGAVFTEDPPAITATGTVANQVIFQRDNSTSTKPVIKPTGGAGTVDAGITIQGGDYFTFDGIDITINSGSALEYGYRILAGTSGTNGANYNTIKNCKITLNRTSSTAYGIRQHPNTAPTSSAGTNTNNKYQYITIENAYRGISIEGNGTFRESNLEISNCTIGAETANDIGGNTTQTYGIYATNVDAVTVTNNTVRNVTCTGGSTMGGIYFPGTTSGMSNISSNTLYNLKGSSTAYGIYAITTGAVTVSNNNVYSVSATGGNVNGVIYVQMNSGAGTNNNVYNNLIKTISATGNILGMSIHANASDVTANVYNNVVSDLISSSASTTFTANNGPQVKAININSSSTNSGTVNTYYNSVSIQDDATPPNTCFHMRYGTVDSKNNIFANFSSSGSSAAMYCVYKNQTGGTLTSDYNDLYTSSGASKYIGFNNVTTYNTFANWKGQGFDANSISGDPGYTSTTDLAINATVPNAWNINGMGQPIATVSTDISNNARSTTVAGGSTDLGAYNVTPSSTPASAIQTGTLTNNSTTTYTLSNGRVLGSISWGAGGTVPTAVDVVFYPGVNPPGSSGYAVANGYWVITPTGGSGYTYDITLNYDDAQIGNVTPESNLRVVKSDDGGTSYTPYLSFTPNTTLNTITVTGLNSFSIFGLTNNDAPLPVNLTSFTSNINGRNIKLNWITTSESNNKGFEIQRSMVNGQGIEWKSIGYVNGKGTNATTSTYTYEDIKLNTGKYKYRLKQIDYNGNFEYFELDGIVEIGLPIKFSLSQNYPNPFNPSTKINYDLPRNSYVALKVFDISGREVMTLVNENQPAGFYTAELNGKSFSSGVYIYRLSAKSDGSENVLTKKMLLVK